MIIVDNTLLTLIGSLRSLDIGILNPILDTLKNVTSHNRPSGMVYR